jgi:Ca2+-binding RTX toxin-like protein
MAFVNGTNSADTLYGTSGIDSINGLGGNDVLKGFGGADHLDGGTGWDIAFYDDSPVGVSVNLATGHGFGGTAEGDTLANIEAVYGSAFNDTLTGTNGSNKLDGLSGDDTLDGGFGTDYLNGGDDIDTLKGGGGADVLIGGAGYDTVTYTGSAAGVFVSLITNTAAYGDAEGDTFAQIEYITGSAHADNLWGDNGQNWLTGMNGNDTLLGFGGQDFLEGGYGDDTLFGMDGGDFLVGGNGADTLDGGAGFDVLDGWTGADIMRGGIGSDTYFVDTSADRAIEAAGEGTFDQVVTSSSYALLAGSEVEYLASDNQGGTTALDLVGNEFNQIIVGNDGQNTIVGSPAGDDVNGDGVEDYDGLDVMTGAGGGDVFVWTSTNETTLAGEEADVVTDFNPAEGDLLAFNPIDADGDANNGDTQFTFVGIVDVTQGGSFAGVGQIGYFTTGTDTYILLNTEVDAGVDYQDATIRVVGVHTVDDSWFVL